MILRSGRSKALSLQESDESPGAHVAVGASTMSGRSTGNTKTILDVLPTEVLYYLIAFLAPLELTGFSCASRRTLALTNDLLAREARDRSRAERHRSTVPFNPKGEPILGKWKSITGLHVFKREYDRNWAKFQKEAEFEARMGGTITPGPFHLDEDAWMDIWL